VAETAREQPCSGGGVRFPARVPAAAAHRCSFLLSPFRRMLVPSFSFLSFWPVMQLMVEVVGVLGVGKTGQATGSRCHAPAAAVVVLRRVQVVHSGQWWRKRGWDEPPAAGGGILAESEAVKGGGTCVGPVLVVAGGTDLRFSLGSNPWSKQSTREGKMVVCCC
jgi:hypothetical protein